MSAYKRLWLEREQRDHAAARAAEKETTTPEAPDASASEPAVHPDQQPLFVRGDVSVLAADLARMMEDDDDDHPVVAPFDPYSGCSCGCFDHFLCQCEKPYPSDDQEIPF